MVGHPVIFFFLSTSVSKALQPISEAMHKETTMAQAVYLQQKTQVKIWENIDPVHKRTSGSIEKCRVVVVMLVDARVRAVCNVWRTPRRTLSVFRVQNQR
jgi:hypothetical protein